MNANTIVREPASRMGTGQTKTVNPESVSNISQQIAARLVATRDQLSTVLSIIAPAGASPSSDPRPSRSGIAGALQDAMETQGEIENLISQIGAAL